MEMRDLINWVLMLVASFFFVMSFFMSIVQEKTLSVMSGIISLIVVGILVYRTHEV
jgi:exosortase/archaeosortase